MSTLFPTFTIYIKLILDCIYQLSSIFLSLNSSFFCDLQSFDLFHIFNIKNNNNNNRPSSLVCHIISNTESMYSEISTFSKSMVCIWNNATRSQPSVKAFFIIYFIPGGKCRKLSIIKFEQSMK